MSLLSMRLCWIVWFGGDAGSMLSEFDLMKMCCSVMACSMLISWPSCCFFRVLKSSYVVDEVALGFVLFEQV